MSERFTKQGSELTTRDSRHQLNNRPVNSGTSSAGNADSVNLSADDLRLFNQAREKIYRSYAGYRLGINSNTGARESIVSTALTNEQLLDAARYLTERLKTTGEVDKPLHEAFAKINHFYNNVKVGDPSDYDNERELNKEREDTLVKLQHNFTPRSDGTTLLTLSSSELWNDKIQEAKPPVKAATQTAYVHKRGGYTIRGGNFARGNYSFGGSRGMSDTNVRKQGVHIEDGDFAGQNISFGNPADKNDISNHIRRKEAEAKSAEERETGTLSEQAEKESTWEQSIQPIQFKKEHLAAIYQAEKKMIPDKVRRLTDQAMSKFSQHPLSLRDSECAEWAEKKGGSHETAQQEYMTNNGAFWREYSRKDNSKFRPDLRLKITEYLQNTLNDSVEERSRDNSSGIGSMNRLTAGILIDPSKFTSNDTSNIGNGSAESQSRMEAGWATLTIDSPDGFFYNLDNPTDKSVSELIDINEVKYNRK